MTWLARFGWSLLAIATLTSVVAAYRVDLPEPHAVTVAIDHADYAADANAPSVSVNLPHVPPYGTGDTPRTSHYLATFDLAAVRSEEHTSELQSH